MASLSIPCGVNHPSIPYHRSRRLRLAADWPDSHPNGISTSRRSRPRRAPRISAAATDSSVLAPCPNRISTFGRSPTGRAPQISTAATATDSSVLAPCSVDNGSSISETVDGWMRDSAAEIVKNLREAPLLVQVFASNNGARLETEKAVAEGWPVVTRRWKDGETPPPDGLIFVEELGDGEGKEDPHSVEADDDGTRAWGIVVQGKGAECGPVCYLMKTCRVGSGLGTCSTHFCLTKVQGFRESALSQLANCWLLQ